MDLSMIWQILPLLVIILMMSMLSNAFGNKSTKKKKSQQKLDTIILRKEPDKVKGREMSDPTIKKNRYFTIKDM